MFSMQDTQGIADILVSTKSTDPLCAIVAICTAGSVMKFELNEEMAHSLCVNLDRFLTQGQRQKQQNE